MPNTKPPSGDGREITLIGLYRLGFILRPGVRWTWEGVTFENNLGSFRKKDQNDMVL